MALKTVSHAAEQGLPAGKRLVRLGQSSVAGFSAVYAAVARLLIGGAEDVADAAAARRLRELNAAAARQYVSGTKPPRSRS